MFISTYQYDLVARTYHVQTIHAVTYAKSKSKFIIALFRMIYIRTNNKEGNTLTDSHIQEQQMHSYRVLSATSTKGATHPTVI